MRPAARAGYNRAPSAPGRIDRLGRVVVVAAAATRCGIDRIPALRAAAKAALRIDRTIGLDATYIALDLETTGLNADRDAIIEIAAVRFAGDAVLATFETFVRPAVDLPLRVRQITGLSPDDLAGAPTIEDVITPLRAFVGDTPLVGHSVGHDVRFLARHGLPLEQPAVDTFELASILVPDAARYGLGHLVEHLGLDLPSADLHRALADAEAHRRLFLALFDRARSLPPDVLAAINHMAGSAGWSLAPVFRAASERPATHATAAFEPPWGVPDGAEIPPGSGSSRQPPEAMDHPALEALLAPGGKLSARLADYQDRPAQRAMLREVADVLDRGGQLMIEAGAGVGRGLAYLVPAAACARARRRPVVVAVRSPALLRQLSDVDLPLAGDLVEGVKITLLKERRDYLCPARLAELAGRSDLDSDAVRVAARILVWSTVTSTGDRDELLIVGDDARVWRWVCAGDGACGPGCEDGASATCWAERARARALAADIVVTTQSAVIRDGLGNSPMLPPHDRLVIDEAHHLEAVATRELGGELDLAGASSVWVSLTDHGGVDAATAKASHMPPGPSEVATDDAGTLGEHAADVGTDALRRRAAACRASVEALFIDLGAWFAERVERGGSSVRLTRAVRNEPAWAAVEAAADRADAELAMLDEMLCAPWTVRSAARDGHASEVPGSLPAPSAVAESRRASRDARHVLSSVVLRPDANSVGWVARGPGGQVVLRHAPIFVDEALDRLVFRRLEALVLTSPTLRAGDDFDYVRAQLGLTDARTRTIPSPFDYASAALVFLPTDMPPPDQSAARKAQHGALVSLARALGGRTLALFTSHASLKDAYHAIRKPLGDAGIVVLGQTLDGSLQTVVEGLREADLPTVLLGTSVLWEAVDIPGPALSALVIARLPFGVAADPVFAARSEVYDDPFRDFAVPQAVLRFRQGFERLIRAPGDRGVVAVLDARIRSPSYGWMFLDALPACRRYEGPLADLAPLAARWCAGDTRVAAAGAPSSRPSTQGGIDHD